MVTLFGKGFSWGWFTIVWHFYINELLMISALFLLNPMNTLSIEHIPCKALQTLYKALYFRLQCIFLNCHNSYHLTTTFYPKKKKKKKLLSLNTSKTSISNLKANFHNLPGMSFPNSTLISTMNTIYTLFCVSFHRFENLKFNYIEMFVTLKCHIFWDIQCFCNIPIEGLHDAVGTYTRTILPLLLGFLLYCVVWKK